MGNTSGSGRRHQMSEKIAAFDWSDTPLGAQADWPIELKTAVQQMLDSDFPKAIAWGDRLTTIYNDAFKPILGQKPEALGRPFSEVWAEAWDELEPIVTAAMEGQSTFIEDFPLVIERNGEPEKAYFTFCYSPLKLVDGTVMGMLDTVVETTSTIEARDALALANGELTHRLGNSLAIVRAIASQTLRDATEPEAWTAFEGRLAALHHAHSVLLEQNWSTAYLKQTLMASLEPHAAHSRFSIEGEDVKVGSKTTMALSMVVHELATNAIKYGALSNDTGIVTISWQMENEEFRLTWAEQGGPEVMAPTRTGFGTKLIERSFGGSGSGRISFESSGIVFELKVPARDLSH